LEDLSEEVMIIGDHDFWWDLFGAPWFPHPDPVLQSDRLLL